MRRRIGWCRLVVRSLLLCFALAFGAAGAARCQAAPLTAGSRVRLYVRGVIRPFEGVLEDVGPADLTLAALDGSILTIGRQQIERSEVRGTRRNTWLGAGVGAGVGLGVGVWLVVEHRNDCEGSGGGFCDHGNDPWRLALPTVIGAGAGALVGSLIRTPTWLPGYLPTLTGDAPSGLALAWTLPLGR